MSIGWSCTALQMETPICTRRTTTHQFFWQQQHRCGAVRGSSMKSRVGGQPDKTPHINSRQRYTHTRNDLPKKSLGPAQPPPHRCRTFQLLLVACANVVWPPLRPLSVAQNKPSTMLSSTVQSTDSPKGYMAWRFWTMRQPNDCSTPAPISRRACRG